MFRRSEEHTSELQSPYDLVCRLLLEKKKKKRAVQTQQTSEHVSDNADQTEHCDDDDMNGALASQITSTSVCAIYAPSFFFLNDPPPPEFSPLPLPAAFPI